MPYTLQGKLIRGMSALAVTQILQAFNEPSLKSQKPTSFRGGTTKESVDYQFKKISFAELALRAAVPSLRSE